MNVIVYISIYICFLLFTVETKSHDFGPLPWRRSFHLFGDVKNIFHGSKLLSFLLEQKRVTPFCVHSVRFFEVKPGNLLLSTKNLRPSPAEIKLADFGVAIDLTATSSAGHKRRSSPFI